MKLVLVSFTLFYSATCALVLSVITPRAHARARGYVIGRGVYCILSGVHNAKAEECTTPYMRQNIEINIGVGGLHGNQGY